MLSQRKTKQPFAKPGQDDTLEAPAIRFSQIEIRFIFYLKLRFRSLTEGYAV
jgi:hypothetical protein